SSGTSIVRISAKNSFQLSFPNCSETRSSSSATLYVGLSVGWGKLLFYRGRRAAAGTHPRAVTSSRPKPAEDAHAADPQATEGLRRGRLSLSARLLFRRGGRGIAARRRADL